jgi:fatty acid desaturase
MRLTTKELMRRPMRLCLRTRVALAVCAGALGLAFALWELWGW